MAKRVTTTAHNGFVYWLETGEFTHYIYRFWHYERGTFTQHWEYREWLL